MTLIFRQPLVNCSDPSEHLENNTVYNHCLLYMLGWGWGVLHLELAAQPPTPLLCGCAHTTRPFPRGFNWPNAVLRVALLLLVCSSDSQVNERENEVVLAWPSTYISSLI